MGERTQSGVAGAQLAAAAPPSEALDPSAFYSLYLGGLSFPDRQQRLRASMVITLGGRLGLRPGEIQHLHEEWVDWGRGELVVPDRDPCACKQCWEAARRAQRAGDGRRLLEVVTESTWSPPGEGRTIPFGWSQRLTAVIAMLCEEEGYLDLTAEAMGRLVGQSARRAEGLSQDAVDVRSLRASAVAFFADAGFSPRRVAAIVGEEIDYSQAVARQAGDARERLSELFDGGVADPGDAYALVADPEPFDAEPFDPRTYDAEWRQTRMRQRANQPEALRNPRPMTAAANDALDSSDLGTRAHLDADSDLVDEANAAARLDQWVTRQEASRRDREPTAAAESSPQPNGHDTASAQQSPAATDQPSGNTADGPATAADQQGTAADGQSSGPSPQQSGPSQSQPGGSAGAASSSGSAPSADQRSQASADRAGGSAESPAEGPASGATGAPAGGATEEPPGGPAGGSAGESFQDTDTAEQPTDIGDAAVFNARDHLSGPPAQTVETRVACSEFADGQPTAARVFIGPEELLFVRNDDDSMAPEHARIELSAVVDLSLDYLPDPLTDAFESAVTVAYNRGEGRKLAVVGVTGNERISFANGVFKQVLTECEIVITHPARRGGRVMSTDPVEGTLSVDDRSVSITVDDEETEDFTIQLSDVIYFELEKQTYDEARFRSLSVRHLNSSSEAIKTTIAVTDERKHKLFQRFVRRSYQQRKGKIESLTLTEEYKEVLVALYSAGDQFDISMIIDKPADELQELLRSLGQVGLARMSDNGAVLTGLGHVVVNEKIEDVNV